MKNNYISQGEANKIAVAYTRSSDVVNWQEAIDLQVSKIKNFCEENGFIFKNAYSDFSSGINEDRSQLRQMFNDCQHNEFDVIVVDSKTRISRDHLTGLIYEVLFEANGITLLSINERGS